MISATEAVLVLVAVNTGDYKPSVYSTTDRGFKPSYKQESAGFNSDKDLNNKILMPYRPHEWINK